MMRKLFVLAMVAGLVGMGGFVRDARAGATIDLLFTGVNGAPIAPTNELQAIPVSASLTMALRMTTDEALTIAVFSINYDLEGNNALDPLTVIQWGGVAINAPTKADPAAFFDPIGALSPTTDTFAGSWQGSTTNFGPPAKLLPPGSYQMGTVTWHVNQPGPANGTHVLSGLFNKGVDGIFDGNFNDMGARVAFRSATVNFIPEPGTASLIGLGLVGLVLMGRRSRS